MTTWIKGITNNKVFSKDKSKEPAIDHKDKMTSSRSMFTESAKSKEPATDHKDNMTSSSGSNKVSGGEAETDSNKVSGGEEVIQNPATTVSKKVRRGGKVVIQNLTENTLVLREMIRGVSMPVRYVIGAEKSIEINQGKHNTYYRILVYACIEAIVNDPPTPIDTKLTVDSDFLSDVSHIFISGNQTKGYVITSTKPPPSSPSPPPSL